jgi:crotonobetainyl-CoA:carnitine CoA-transferase CaiB-like acyl-CoA transferase
VSLPDESGAPPHDPESGSGRDPLTEPAGPLHGIRVIDFGRFIAIPYAGVALADMGADVIKVEDPDHADDARRTGPHFLGGESLYYLSLNWGKRSLAVRLTKPEGRAIVLDLVASADAVMDNFRPGVMAKLGLDHAALSAVNPRIITCALTGFGETGTYAARPGYDYTLQAVAGAMSLTGEPGGPPGKAGVSYVDHSGGLAAALAVCAAIIARDRSGVGRHVDLGLVDTQISMLSYLAGWTLNAGMTLERTAHAAHQSLVPAQNFATRDGWVSVFVGNDPAWNRLTTVLVSEQLRDARYARNEGRLEHRDELIALLAVEFATLPTLEWVNELMAAGVPCAPVNSVADALASPPVRERHLVESAHNDRYGEYQHAAGPIPALGGAGLVGGPPLGNDSVAVLRDIGYSASAIDRLIADGTVVTAPPSRG